MANDIFLAIINNIPGLKDQIQQKIVHYHKIAIGLKQEE